MEEILRFENVTIGYGEKDVVKDFSCTVKRGEFVSLIGPNGSGKSTLIHAITGIVGIKSGKVYIDGKDNANLSAKERAQITAVVPQTFQAGFAFKAKEIVAMGRHPFLKRMQSETEEDYKLIDQALEQTGTLSLRERKITQLSGGERQRIIISAALAQQPQLLILDEPTNHLDIQYTLEVMQLMQKLNREQGITIFAVLHDINMAARFSDRILVLNEGRKVRDGQVSEIIREEVLKPVYKIDLVVRENPLTNAAEIVPLRSNKMAQRTSNGKRVHIICGGGSGSYIIEAFHNKGFEVSCGVLNVGDSDYELCQSLGIKTVAEKPYCEISSQSFDENRQTIESADLVVLTDVDIGRSNLKNIEVLEHLSSQKLYIVRENASDYTGGIGDRIIRSLLSEERALSLGKDQLMSILNE